MWILGSGGVEQKEVASQSSCLVVGVSFPCWLVLFVSVFSCFFWFFFSADFFWVTLWVMLKSSGASSLSAFPFSVVLRQKKWFVLDRHILPRFPAITCCVLVGAFVLFFFAKQNADKHVIYLNTEEHQCERNFISCFYDWVYEAIK